jgi:hypothetical protein
MRDYNDLLSIGTPAEQEAILSVNVTGSYVVSAAALGLSPEAVRSRIREARRRLKRHDGAGAELPPGQVLDATSVLTGPGGELKARWDKSKRAPDEPPAFETVPPAHHITKLSTMLGRQGETLVQWVQAKPDRVEQDAAWLAAIRASCAEYVRPVEPLAAPASTDSETETHYMLGDPHIGMLAYAPETGEAFDLKIAERDLLGAMDRLVAGAPPSSVGVLCPLGDNFHADDDRQVTPAHGHKLSVDSRAVKVARVGVNIMRRLIDRGLEKHDVMHVRIMPGNHDPVTSRWLALVLEMLYENEERVIVHSNVNPVQMWEFGLCMFMLSHGDGFKLEQSAGIMAAREPAMWGRTRFRYSDQGHKHSDGTVELPGVLARRHRTLAPKDDFANKFGFESGRDAKAFTFHKRFGEIECKTVGVDFAREGLT